MAIPCNWMNKHVYSGILILFTIHMISTWRHLLIKRNKLFITMTLFGLKEREKLTIDSQISKAQMINTWWNEPLIWSLPHCCAVSNVVRWSLCLCIWPLILLTDRRDPALALATDSFSFSAARRWTAWKLFRAAEKSLISRSLWIFCCLWTPPRKAKQMVWHQLETQGGIHNESQMSNGRNNEWHNNLPRESTAILEVSVYIPPTPNNNGIEVRNSVNFVLPSVSNKQPIQMDFLILAWDVNHANLKNVLPDRQQQVVFPTNGNNTLDLVYTTDKGAYKAFPLPNINLSDHITSPIHTVSECSDPALILHILLSVKVLDAARGEISFRLWCGYAFVKK